MSIAALEAEVARLQAENGHLRRALADVSERIVVGRLTGELPDNFLEQFSHLPDRPLEQVLRFLPAHQVVQMRHVSRRFNGLIKKCSKTMPKGKGCEGAVVFKSYHTDELILEWMDDSGSKITKTKSAVEQVPLSELLRFIRIDGPVFFGDGLSAADGVLEQLSKAWLTIRPEMVIFSGDLSQTSTDCLKTFLVKVEPFVKRLHFQNASNIGDHLLSDGLIAAAGRLDGLMVLPMSWSSEQHDICIGDETLLSFANSEKMPSYFFTMGCASFTPGGIRAFVEKWIKKEKPRVDQKPVGIHWGGWETCELTFYKCANVTPATVEEACGDLLKKEAVAGGADTLGPHPSGETDDRVRYRVECVTTNRRLDILFHYDPFRSHFIDEPRLDFMLDDIIDDDYDLDPEIDDDDDDDDDDYDGYDPIDFDDDGDNSDFN